jgi:hypothetical protein
VAQFVQQHAEEQGQDEAHSDRDGGDISLRLPVTQRDPRDQYQERHVHVHADARQRRYFPGPFHPGHSCVINRRACRHGLLQFRL